MQPESILDINKIYNTKLKNNLNDNICLNDYKNKNIVLFFYPKDKSIGCSIQARKYNFLASEFSKFDTVVIGVSGGNADSKKSFCEKNNFNFTLLADENYEMAKLFASLREIKLLNKKFRYSARHTFIFDKNKKLIAEKRKVSILKDAQESLEIIKNLS